MPDGPRSSGDNAQVRLIVEQALDAAIVRLGAVPSSVPSEPKVEIPPPLKWAAGIVASLMSLAMGAMVLWLVTTLNEMQLTVARIDERQQSQVGDVDGRFAEVNRRIGRLEARNGRTDRGEVE
jgi:hypothetical protein